MRAKFQSRYFLSSHRLPTMRLLTRRLLTRRLLLRNSFHTYPHGSRTEVDFTNITETNFTNITETNFTNITENEQKPLQTIWDNCAGVPHNHTYLARLLQTMQSPTYSDYPAITERQDYDTKQSTTYSYRKLGTDIFGTRRNLLVVEGIEKRLRAVEVSRGFSVGLMADRSYEFVVNLLGLFSIGARPVLISNTSKPPEIASLLETAKSSFLIPPSKLLKQPWVEQFTKDHPEYTIWANEALESWKDMPPLPENKLSEGYLILTSFMKQGTLLFTSGTTGKPKAVFTDISSINRQCSGLRNLWEYTEEDRILHVLPNHHIHGLVNCLLTPLTAGSAIEFITQPFNPHKILDRISKPPSIDFPPITMFHGVPTMYSSFISAYESYPPQKKQEIAKGLRSLRVAVCGSAALPVPIAQKWEEITGSIPLERYGMTETGMVFSNSIDVPLRKLGSVGYPMPNVHTHLIDPNDRLIMVPHVPGRLIVRWQPTSQLFHKYWDDIHANNRARVKPEQVANSAIEKIENGKVVIKQFKRGPKTKVPLRKKLKDNWFRTGDMAIRGEDGEYYILGRESVDIMKVAGHLVSALEIEREILSFLEIAEVAVVGVKYESFGSIPQAIIVLKPEYAEKYNSNPGYKRELLESLRKRARERLSEEKLPRRWIVADSIPRNAMGKVNKKQLLADKTFFPRGMSSEVTGEGKEVVETKESEEVSSSESGEAGELTEESEKAEGKE